MIAPTARATRAGARARATTAVRTLSLAHKQEPSAPAVHEHAAPLLVPSPAASFSAFTRSGSSCESAPPTRLELQAHEDGEADGSANNASSSARTSAVACGTGAPRLDAHTAANNGGKATTAPASPHAERASTPVGPTRRVAAWDRKVSCKPGDALVAAARSSNSTQETTFSGTEPLGAVCKTPRAALSTVTGAEPVAAPESAASPAGTPPIRLSKATASSGEITAAARTATVRATPSHTTAANSAATGDAPRDASAAARSRALRMPASAPG